MSIYNRNEPEPGEWQEEIDKFGGVKRFRMIGHIKEYEPTITINGLEIPQSQLADYHRRQTQGAARGIYRTFQKTLGRGTLRRKDEK